jgi:hypothetical protein
MGCFKAWILGFGGTELGLYIRRFRGKIGDCVVFWFFSLKFVQEDRKPPSADAILRWIPAFAGMTR